MYDSIINWISKLSIKETRREKFIQQFQEENHIDERIIIFDELAELCEDNPQEIIDIVRNQVENIKYIVFLFLHFFEQDSKKKPSNPDDDLIAKIKSISVFWETSHLFKLPAYLLTKKRINISALKEQKQILKSFKFIGLSNNEIDLIRKIRNAHFHPFDIIGKVLVNDKGEEVANVETINLIYFKIKELESWWIQTLMFLYYCNPHFSVFSYYGIKDEIESKQLSYKDYFNFFFPLTEKEEKETLEVLEQPPLLAIWITKGWRFIKHPIKESKRIFGTKLIEDGFSKNTQLVGDKEIIDFLKIIQKKIFEFGDEMSSVSNKLTSEKDIVKMKKMAISIKHLTTENAASTSPFNRKVIDLLKRKFNKKYK